MSTDMTKELQNAEAAAKRFEEAQRLAEQAMKNLAVQAGKSGVSIASYSGDLSAVDQAAGKASQTISKLFEAIGGVNVVAKAGEAVFGFTDNLKKMHSAVETANKFTNTISDISKFSKEIKNGTDALVGYKAESQAVQLAQKGLQAALGMGPWGWVAVGAAAAATALVAFCLATNDTVSAQEQSAQRANELNEKLKEQAEANERLAKSRAEGISASNAEADMVKTYVKELEKCLDADGRVKDGMEDRAAYYYDKINQYSSDLVTAHYDERDAIYEIGDAYEDVIRQKQRTLALDLIGDEWQGAKDQLPQALQNLTEAEEGLTESERNLAAAIEARDNYYRNLSPTQLGGSGIRYDEEVKKWEQEVENWTETVDGANAAVNDLYNTIEMGELAFTMDFDDPAELDRFLLRMSDSIVQYNDYNSEAVSGALDSAMNSVDRQLNTCMDGWDELEEYQQNAYLRMLESFLDILEVQAEEASKAGIEIPNEFMEGILAHIDDYPEAVQEMFRSSNLFMDEAAVDAYNSAAEIPENAAQGVTDNGDTYVNAVETMVEDGEDVISDYVDDYGTAAGEIPKSMASAVKEDSEFKAAIDSTMKDGQAIATSQAGEYGAPGNAVTENLADGVQSNEGKFLSSVTKLFGKGLTDAKAVADKFEAIGKGVPQSAAEGAEGQEGLLVNSASELMRAAKNEMDQSIPDFKATGANTIEGYIKGMNSKKESLKSAASKLAQQALDAMKETLDINSPSRVMRDEVGLMAAKGLAIGMENGITYVRKSAQKMGDAIVSQLDSLHNQLAAMEAAELKASQEKELAAYEKSLQEKKNQLKGLKETEVEAREKVLAEIAKLEDDWNEKQLKAQQDAAKDALKSQISALEALQKEYDSAIAAIESKQNSMADKLSAYGSLFERVTDSKNREYLKLGDLQEDIDQITAYGQALEELKDLGISESLLGEITAMSIDDAMDYSKELLKMAQQDGAFEEYMALWEEKQEKAAEIARQFYQEEFKRLDEEFVDQMPQELDSLRTGMMSIGENSAKGLAEGFWEQKPYIVRTFKSVLEAALSEAKASMKIRSPSRRWAEIGSFMAQGLGVGFTDTMKDVAKQINNSIPLPTVQTSGLSKIGEGIVNGVAQASQFGTSQHIVIEVPVHLDGKTVTRVVADNWVGVQKQRGIAYG